MVPIPTGVWAVPHDPPVTRTVTVVRDAQGRIGLPRDGPLRVWVVGNTLRGFWVGAAPSTGNAYAAPVTFTQIAARTWRGTYTPLDTSADVHFIALPGPTGDEAFVRDPIANVGAAVGTLHAAASDDGVRWNGTDGRTIATYDAAHDSVRVALPGAPPVIAVRERAQAQPAPASAHDPYWMVVTPQRARMDAGGLTRLAQALASVTVTSVHAPFIQSMIVARGRGIVFERYFSGFTASRPHDLRSASKSITPILLGVAMQQHAPIDPAKPIVSYFDYSSLANDSASKRAITVADALAMETGLACDDYDDASAGNEDRMQATHDWYKFSLDLPMLAAPGSHAAYCSGGINLVTGAIAAATHEWTARLFADRLAAPMGITDYYLPMTPTGELYGGGGMWMRPRDFMKFGRLYVQHGVWNGRELLSSAWIAQTIAQHSVMTGDDTYGYGWHLRTYTIGGRAFHSFEAGGNGGQLLAVFPDDDLEVMMTAANYGDFRAWRNFHDYITGYVLPAVR